MEEFKIIIILVMIFLAKENEKVVFSVSPEGSEIIIISVLCFWPICLDCHLLK